MNKKIIICCDGTWNKPGQMDHGSVTETNVQRICKLIVENDVQHIKYVTGVGSGKTWMNKFFGGGFGSGLNKKILEAYSHIVDLYEENAEIFLFGFSRGAYTARSVAGFIRKCGILKKGNSHLMENAFGLYRSTDSEDIPASEKMTAFRKEYSHPSLDIKCIAVWDTVGALGIPFSRFSVFNDDILELSFHDQKLSSYVQNAFHALAIDEKRKIFNATLWQERNNYKRLQTVKQRIEQVWFAGVHTNIGGGYKDDKLCNISLLWMIDRVYECGLEFDRQKVVDEVVKKRDEQFAKAESYTGFYKLMNPFTRNVYARRDTYEMIHHSAIERFNKESAKYRPENLLHALGLGIEIDSRESSFK